MTIRRLLFVALLTFIITLSAAAQRPGLQALPDNGETVTGVIAALQRVRDGHRASVVEVDWETWAFVIPAAGSVQGANNTFFRSDVTIANRGDFDQYIAVAWFARSVNNGNASVKRFIIPASTTVIERDFVGRILGQSGLGSILVVATDSSGNVDETAEIDGFSRIWTPQPGTSGTTSQEFAAVSLEDTLATSYAYGLRQDAGYRTNVGLVNIWDTENTFTINVVGLQGQTSFTQRVLPYSMEQVSIPAGNWSDLYLRIESAPTNFNWWSAYGVSVDNVTGDGWISHVH